MRCGTSRSPKGAAAAATIATAAMVETVCVCIAGAADGGRDVAVAKDNWDLSPRRLMNDLAFVLVQNDAVLFLGDAAE